MKKIQLRAAIDAAKTIKVTKIEDSNLRHRLITLNLHLLDEQEAFDKELRKLETVLLGAYEAKYKEVLKKRDDIAIELDPAKKKELTEDILRNYPEVLAAERAYRRQAVEAGDKEIKTDLIPRAAFIDAMTAQDWDFAHLEDIHPLLEPEKKTKK
jgi:hypothetical protein